MTIWVLAVLLVAQYAWTVKIALSRDRYKAALMKSVEAVRALTASLEEVNRRAREQNPLTQSKPRVEDAPKRYSGAQLRRLADQMNVTPPEKTNSEILQEQANG
jgi:hypothetical protein